MLSWHMNRGCLAVRRKYMTCVRDNMFLELVIIYYNIYDMYISMCVCVCCYCIYVSILFIYYICMYALNQCWKIGKYTLGGQKSWMIIKLGIVYEIVWYKLVCSIPVTMNPKDTCFSRRSVTQRGRITLESAWKRHQVSFAHCLKSARAYCQFPPFSQEVIALLKLMTSGATFFSTHEVQQT